MKTTPNPVLHRTRLRRAGEVYVIPLQMRDLLPPILADFLRDRYIAGVAQAEASFDESSADEDALTGALGQAISMPDPLFFTSPDGDYRVRITYRKVRGRARVHLKSNMARMESFKSQ